MTIVCATEFSEESALAVSVAGELAKKHDQRLVLVHVLTGALAWGTDVEAAASVALAHDANELARSGVKVDVALLEGRLGQSVGQFCLDRNASVLVVGDTQDTGTLLATTLDKLAYAVEIPMLVVRDPRPFHAWLAEEAPLRVLLALDHSAASAVARNWIFRLAEYGPLDLVGAHIWWPHEEYARRQLAAPSDGSFDGLARMMATETGNALSTMPANVKHRVHLEMGIGHIDEQLLALGVA
ncbi:MAG: Universal stress protein, partial [Myxococcaceae bacterium]|nr:Universal stress protein [Myxococcaceae bacterium]